MFRVSLVLIFSIILVTFFSCSNNKEFEVGIDVKGNYVENELHVEGITNLPDGAMVFVILKPIQEKQVIVKDGKFETVFSFSGKTIPNGNYTLEVVFVPEKNEKERIRNIILADGENVFEQDGIKYYYIGNDFTINNLVSDEELSMLVGEKVPYDKWSEWGSPKTLDETNSVYWSVYLDKADISFVSKKETDTILYAGRGIVAVDSFFSEREELIKSGFSAWDGSHIKLTSLIKASMNDPKSYEHVKTVYWDEGDYLIVKTDFRGSNAFGATVLNFVKAKVSLDGEIIDIIEE